MERYEYLDAAGRVTRTVTGFSVEADGGIAPGEVAWRLVSQGSQPAPGTPDAIRDVLLRKLAAVRYQRETAGTQTPEGVAVLTGRDDQAMTLSAYTTLKEGFAEQIQWKSPSGWRPVALADLEPIARACAQHVQRCFAAEGAVAKQIAALDDTELQGFDVAGAFAAAF